MLSCAPGWPIRKFGKCFNKPTEGSTAADVHVITTNNWTQNVPRAVQYLTTPNLETVRAKKQKQWWTN